MNKLFENWRKHLEEAAYEPGRAVADIEASMGPEDDELSFEDRDKFVEAYNIIGKAVERGTLPEAVEDAVFDMLGKLGIYL